MIAQTTKPSPVDCIGSLRLIGILTVLSFQVLGHPASAAEAKAESGVAFDPLAELDRYDVVWDTPSQDAAGSMPIGNGEVGLNVWVEANGDLRFYISRTDTWSECNRLLKLGRVRVSLSPNPFVSGTPFRQASKLRDGQIEITAGDATLRVFVDAEAPLIHVVGRGQTPRTVTATLENWRTEKRRLTGEELASSWTMQAAPAAIEVWESPDVVASTPASVTWYHRNEFSVVPLTLKHQGLESLAHLVRDPLLKRTFGGRMTGPGFVSEGSHTLKSAKPAKEFSLSIATHTAQTRDAEEWQKQIAPASDSTCCRLTARRTVRAVSSASSRSSTRRTARRRRAGSPPGAAASRPSRRPWAAHRRATRRPGRAAAIQHRRRC